MDEFEMNYDGWDSIHRERSKAIAKDLLKRMPMNPGMIALDYGAGTGILSALLSDKFSEITLMDIDPEMIETIKEIASKYNLKNFHPVLFDLGQSPYQTKTFDCIFTQMVLHHIPNIELLLNRFYELLNPGGHLAIAELYSEDGSFHGKGFTGHNGFDVKILKQELERIGFVDITSEQCFTMSRTQNGVVREYPIFLLIATKRNVSK